MIARIALRNVVRHRRRSLLTAIAIVVSYTMLLMFTGIADGSHEQMAEIGVRMGLGDVVVQANGAEQDPGLDHLVSDPAQVVEAMHALGPEVVAVAPRLRTDALIQAGGTGVGVQLSGVDPVAEEKSSKIEDPKAFVSGRSLAEAPDPGNPVPPIVIGKTLAENLGARVGDRVTITLKPAGSAATRTGAFRVTGIFKTGVHEVDSFWAETPLGAAQALAGTGKAVSMVAVLLQSTAQSADAATRLSAVLPSSLSVLPWQRAAPDLYATIMLDQGGMYLMMVIVFLVVLAGILNTILMSVLERTHEFGVLLAVGAKPSRIVRIVLTEAFGLGAFSLLVGLALGLLVNHYFATVGLDVKAAFGGKLETNGILLPDRFYADLSAVKVLWSMAVVMTLVVVGAVYPAARAARLQPVEAMRHA